MKVALVNLTTTTQFGGVESFVWEVARGLARCGVETTIASGRGPVHRSLPGVRVVEFPFCSRVGVYDKSRGLARAYTLTKLFERLTFGAAALPFLGRAGFDILHIQKPYDLPVGVVVKSLGAGRLVFGCHGTDFFPGDRFFASRADASVSCSRFNAEQVRADYGFTPRVIFNGIDPTLFSPQPRDPELRAALAGDAPLILYVGRLVQWKGIQYLLAALARLAPERRVRLAIVGAGDYRSRLEQQVSELGLQDRVTFVGFVPPEQLPRYYAASDLVCLASYANETFSISILEAMACGRATVGSNFGGIPEVIADGETGSIVRPESSEELAQQIAALVDDPARREQMGEAGRRRALEYFTWDKVTERALQVYREISKP